MSQIDDITVYDGASTPVLHTLKPVSVTREKGKVVSLWREVLPTLPVYAQVAVTMQIERLKSGVWRTETRVEVPVMEAVLNQNASGYTAAPKVAYTNTMIFTSYTHERSTVANRRLARQLLVNLSGSVIVSVPGTPAGPLPELVDTLIAPT